MPAELKPKVGSRAVCFRTRSSTEIYSYGFGSYVGQGLNPLTNSHDDRIVMEDEAKTEIYGSEVYWMPAEMYDKAVKGLRVVQIAPHLHRVAQARMKDVLTAEIDGVIKAANGGTKDGPTRFERMGLIQSSDGRTFVVADMVYTRELSEAERAALTALMLPTTSSN